LQYCFVGDLEPQEAILKTLSAERQQQRNHLCHPSLDLHYIAAKTPLLSCHLQQLQHEHAKSEATSMPAPCLTKKFAAAMQACTACQGKKVKWIRPNIRITRNQTEYTHAQKVGRLTNPDEMVMARQQRQPPSRPARKWIHELKAQLMGLLQYSFHNKLILHIMNGAG